MKTLIKSLVLAVFLLSGTSIFAQTATLKIGHLNSGDLLSSLESWKAAQTQLETHAKMLQDKLVAQQKTLDDEAMLFQKKVDAGNATQKEVTEKQQYFQAKYQELDTARKNAQAELGNKETELAKPILDKVKTAIQDVAKEGGFQYIFDNSVGATIFADPTMDVTALVRAKIK